MKINKLRLKNLNSLKGEHEIDFAAKPLSENGIFAITGPTGAGKTTLLDAICLALYHQIPRTGSQKMSKNHLIQSGAICTRNTMDSYAEVEYCVNDKEYRSSWSIRVNNRGNLADYEMTLADVSTGEVHDLKKSEVPKRNEEIIGLGFEQFLKSSLLAQGEFAKFLKADKDERGKLLENITGTTIYREIGAAAFDKQKQEKEKLDLLEKGVALIELLSEEQLAKLDEETKRKEEEREANTQQIAQLNDTQQRHELIQKDQKSLIQKNQEGEEVQQQILAFDTEKELLSKHRKVAVHQELIGQYESLTKEVDLLNEKSDRDTNLKIIQQKSLADLKLETAQLELAQTEKETALVSMQPMFKQVKQWDIEIAEGGRILHHQSIELEEIKGRINKQSLGLAALDKDKTAALERKSSCDKYLTDHEGLKDLTEALSGLEKQYALAKDLTDDCHQVRDALALNDQHLSIDIKALKKPDEIYQYIGNQLAKYQAVDDITAQVDSHRLKVNDIGHQVNTHKELHRQAIRIQSDQLELDKISTAIINHESQLEDLNKWVDKLGQQKEIQNLAVEELEIRHQRQQLEAKYEDDRHTLIQDEPCPLCGSEQHPYVSHYTNTVSQTAKDLSASKKELVKIETKLIEHQEAIKSTQLKIEESQDKLATLSEVTKSALDELKTLSVTINAEVDLALFKTPSFVSEAEQLLHEAEAMLNLLIAQEKKQQDYITLGSLQSAAKKAKQAADLYKSEVAPYSEIIGNSSMPKLEEAAKLYEDNKFELQQTVSKLQTIEKEAQLSAQSIDDNNGIKDQKEKVWTSLKTKLTTKEKKRREEFGTKDPEKEQSDLLQSIDDIKSSHHGAKVEFARLSESIQSLETSIVSLMEDLKEKQDKYQVSTKDLTMVAKRLNLSAIEDLRKCLLSTERVEDIEEKDRLLDRKKETIAADISRLSGVIAELGNKLPKDYDYLEAKKLLESLEAERDSQIKRINEIEFKLKSNRENETKNQKLRIEIERQKAVFSKWKKLSELIGSGDGKVFSIFAQNLTLQHLIFLANKHLSSLNDRYLLFKDANDDKKEDIYIRDQYQGNAERSVSTLSGGESFIVSLSLALGLSEMASKNIKIESLFIDEGFGTLDQNTLDTVLTVLEQLQYKSSCSIGVISHVEQLKERITTQIMLDLNAAGHSTIEVVG